MTSFETQFLRQLNIKDTIHFSDYCESLSLQVYQNGKKKIDFSWGEDYLYYDLASLTKPIFTLSAFIKMTEEHPHLLEMDVGEILGWPNYLQVKVRHLLSHGSGLTWWKPIYKKIHNGSWRDRREHLAKLLQQEKTNPQSVAIYSDLDYLVLGFVMEVLLNKDLHQCWLSLKSNFSKNSLHFVINDQLKNKRSYAPTYSHQIGPSWVQGLVNDANTQSLGGISSHAGLFGQIEDVSNWLLMLRKSLLSNSNSHFVTTKTIKKFIKREFSPGKGDWSLGFMLPSNDSSSGKYFSKKSVGHLGFTGTSFWWDPKKDVFVVLLANRYIQENTGEEFKSLRPKIHNAVMESLGYG
ncbi:MAG: serine hydrolase [Bdellovibrionaceae bacterium]|nr:serine hydrolase [Pseudobdellovibrionaceae bacterium]